MNGVIYYSNTGQSRAIAEFFSRQTAFPLFDIYELTAYEFDTAVLVFPVHCQSVPDPVKRFLESLRVKSLAVIAAYGRMCCGNVLHEIQKRYRHSIIAAAYVPTKHAYSDESGFADFDALAPIVAKLGNPAAVKIPKAYKNPLSDLCKGLRSRIGVKLYKDASRCDNCGVCNSVCKNNAMYNGKADGKCIRCLKCVAECPNNALRFALRLPMRLYLRKKKRDRLVIYSE